jgi:hypothetical protein
MPFHPKKAKPPLTVQKGAAATKLGTTKYTQHTKAAIQTAGKKPSHEWHGAEYPQRKSLNAEASEDFCSCFSLRPLRPLR